jgi:PEGA domain-containing protein
MSLRGLSSLLSLVILLTAARAQSAEGEAPTVVLGLEALNGAPDSVATEITDALRQRVAATKGFQLLQGKDLVELKLVFGCSDEAPACMSQAGKSLGATKLIFGNVKQAGENYQISLKLLDVNRGVIESFTADTVPKKRAEANVLRSLAPGWMAKLTGKGGGSIQVRSNLAGAEVSLDGTRVGTTGAAPVIINDVAPGRHEVAIEKSGYTTTKQEFSLAAGQSLPLNLTSSAVSVEVPRPEGGQAAPAPAEDVEPSSSGSLTRIGFWVATVGALTSAALWAKFGLDVRDINRQLDPYRRLPCTAAPSGYCDGNGKPVDASMLTLSQSDLQFVHSKTQEGDRDRVLQWVFVGLTGAFAIAGGVLLYKGYLASEGTQSASNHGLRLFPTASASSGGIIAEFDF